MDSINYFVAETDLPQQDSDNSYGPMGTSQYRVTSLFNGDTDIMTYAATSGKIFIVDQLNSSERVNVILLPDNLIFGASVKYFIYRGILKSDFLDSGNSYIGIKPPESTDSNFINNLRKGQNPDLALDLYNDLSDDYFIDDLFLSDQYQFGLVTQGDSIGRFDSQSSYGFEILLNETFFFPTLGVARLDVNVVDISDSDDVEAAKLQILNYIDPAAYYGLYSHSAFSIGTNNTSTPLSVNKQLVYTFISRFYTKNVIYIDIRNEYEQPIDWYDDSPQNIKLTTDATSAAASAAISYRGPDLFPIKILLDGCSNSKSNDIGQGYFTLTLSLPTSDNPTALLTLNAGYWLKFVTSLQEDMYFSICTSTNDWSDDKTFTIFSATDANEEVPVASFLKLELGNYYNMDAIDNQIPNDNVDETDTNFYVTGLFPFHTEGLPEYKNPN